MLKMRFWMGVAVGVVVILVLLQVWGTYLQRSIASAAQPQVLLPLRHATSINRSAHHDLPLVWLPGSPATNRDSWRLQRVGGEPVTLRLFDGKVIFLNLWSTTCTPCIAEMPDIERLAKSMSGENIVFLLVTPDEEQQVTKFLQQNPLQLPVYLGGKDIPEDLGFEGFPTTVVFDNSGSAVLRQIGAGRWNDERVRSYLRTLAGKQ